MAVKGKTPQPLPVDAALRAHMTSPADDPVYGNMEKVSRARNMTPAQQRQAEKDARRNRAMFDLPKELEQVVDALAAEHSVTRSGVAAYLMLIGLKALEEGAAPSIGDAKEASRSMRYDFVVVLPELPKTFKKLLPNGGRER